MGVLNVSLKIAELDKEKRQHSLSVAKLAHHLAHKVGLNSGFAYLAGQCHDIGYALQSDKGHAVNGYLYLMKNKLDDVALVALYHSKAKDKYAWVRTIDVDKALLKRVQPYIDLISVANYYVKISESYVQPHLNLDAIVYAMERKYSTSSKEYRIAKEEYQEFMSWFERNNLDPMEVLITWK